MHINGSRIVTAAGPSAVSKDHKSARMASYLYIRYAERDNSEQEPMTVPFETIRAMREHIQQLEDNIAILRSGTARSQLGSKVNRAALDALEQASNGVAPAVRQMWDLVPVQRRPTADSAIIAERVFGTAELLESILSHLDAWDMLEVYGVNKQWQANIIGSVRLQRDVMAITPDPGHVLYQPFDYMGEYSDHWTEREEDPDSPFRGLRSETALGPDIRPYTVELGDGTRHIIVDQYQALEFVIRPAAFAPGVRSRSMLLCQPPVTELEITGGLHAPWNGRPTRYPIVRLRVVTGVTVGDFYDAARQYLRDHGVNCGCTVVGVNKHVHAYGMVLLPEHDRRVVDERKWAMENLEIKAARRAGRVANGEPDEDSAPSDVDSDASIDL